jgi:hypothetical protein
MRPLRLSIFAHICALSLGLLSCVARADFTKTIQAKPGVPVQAATTWYYASCTQSLGVGSYSINVAPKYGALSFSTVSGPLPGCPAGSPSLPAAAAFYTLSNSVPVGTADYFQLYYLENGGVAEVLDITVNPAPADSLTITTTGLPSTISGDAYSYQLTSSGGQGTVTWSASGDLPDGFSLSPSGLLSNSGTPLPYPDAGTYSITVTATDSLISVSKTFALVVISEDCSANATIDTSKILVDTDPDLTPVPTGPDLFLNTGNTLAIPDARRGGLTSFSVPFYGIEFITLPDLVTLPANSIPESDINLVFVQTLDVWDGSSVYSGPDGDFVEWNAMPLPSSEDDYPSQPIDYEQAPSLNGPWSMADSPQVHAPMNDPKGRHLAGMHYLKNFTVYIGCHTMRDETRYPLMKPISGTDPRHFIRTFAIAKWGVNYAGSVRFSPLSCFNPLNRFNCLTFDPDPGAGVQVISPPASETIEPPVTDRVMTTYHQF